jgi:enoyl-CoA hydratase
MTTPDSPRGTDAPVLTRIDDRAGRVTLNRPSALHALNLEMCADMLRALLAWRGDRGVKAVLLDHAGERGFCAGGDIRAIVGAGIRAQEAAQDFFRTEYQLNHLLFTYPKPTVAFVDGIVMGGGVGISMPCRFRVATERTLFAMPETAIGLFPDVGGGWYLPRLPGQVGTWLALTGARLRGADCVGLGIATHFVPSERLPELKRAIVDVVSAQDDEFAASVITTELNRFTAEPGLSAVEPQLADIDRLFAFDTVEEIFAALEADGGEWAAKELEGLRAKSPQALKITLRQMREGARMASFEDEMSMEFRLASRVALLPDFAEGVRACLIDKDQAPRWNPPTLEDVGEDLLRTVFARLPADVEWTPAA